MRSSSLLSQRHRIWGLGCPAVDIDFLLLEYRKNKAVAIIEYKHEWAKVQHSSHPSYQAMIDLGDRAGVPVFACKYAGDFSWFKFTPLNKKAMFLLPNTTVMSEKEYVSFFI